MSWSSEVVYNRTDCPYGCGTALPEKLRWSATPCPGCQRPLYPLRALQSDHGAELWPPQDVPRPPLVSPQGAVVWYVVGEEDHAEWARIHTRITNDRIAERRRKSQRWGWLGPLPYLSLILVSLYVYYYEHYAWVLLAAALALLLINPLAALVFVVGWCVLTVAYLVGRGVIALINRLG